MQKSLSFVVRLYFTSANYYLRRNTTVLAMPGQNQNIKSFFTPLGTKRTNESNGGSEEPVEKLNKTSSDYDKLEFDCKKKSEEDKECSLKISTWNVAGLRAWIKKGGLDYLQYEKPDVLCLQEIKCSKDKLPVEIKECGYKHQHYFPAKKEGYSGVALLSKIKPIKVDLGFGIPEGKEHDAEGRVITAEFDEYFVVTTYVPNAGDKLVTLPKRMEWDPLLRSHVKKLDEIKPVILCGDLNVAHKEIDLTNPKAKIRSAGFTQEERDGFDDLLNEGFVDTYRHFYPDLEKKYSFWSFRNGNRGKNIGWRLDYFVTSKRLVNRICDNQIRDQVFGSDHCPCTLFLAL